MAKYVPFLLIFLFSSYFGTRYALELAAAMFSDEQGSIRYFLFIFIGVIPLIAMVLPIVVQYLSVESGYISLTMVFILPVASTVGFYEGISEFLNGFPDESGIVPKSLINAFMIVSFLFILLGVFMPSWMLNLVWHRRNQLMRKEQQLYIYGFIEIILVLLIYHFMRQMALGFKI